MRKRKSQVVFIEKIISSSLLSLSLLSTSCTKTTPQLDAYLYRVFDNYSLCMIKGNCPIPKGGSRYMRFEYVVKNETSDTLLLPISIVHGWNSYHSHITIRDKTRPFDVVLGQTLSRRERDVVLAKGGSTVITITLYRNALDSIGIKPHDLPSKVVQNFNFFFSYNRRDSTHFVVPQINFHNTNNKDKNDLYNGGWRTTLYWDVQYDSTYNIFYCFHKPGVRIPVAEIIQP